MKILSAIIAHPLRKVSGATNAGFELSLATAAKVDLDLAIMWDRDETEQVGPLTVRRFNSTTRVDWAGSRIPRFIRVPLYDSRIPEAMAEGGYDLVHIHNMVPTFAAARLAAECQRRAVPYVISTHGFYEIQRYAEINGFGMVKSFLIDHVMTRPFRRAVAGASAICALSDCEVPSLRELGVAEKNIHVVTNGVKEYFLETPPEAELGAARVKYKLGSQPLLLFMGSLHAYKGVDIFLRSLPMVPGEYQAVVAGSFKSEDEKSALLHRTGAAPETLRRLTFTGRVTDAELRALYHLATMLVYPTMGDTLPLVVLEAMACGLPVVSTRIGGIPFAVRPETGILVEPGDPFAVSQAVNAYLQNDRLRKAAGDAGRARVRQVFRWPSAAISAVGVYEKVLNKTVPMARMAASASPQRFG